MFCKVRRRFIASVVIDCATLPSPLNGEVKVSDGSLFDSVANYTCRVGYTLSGGPPTRTCQANGIWSNTQPSCTGIKYIVQWNFRIMETLGTSILSIVQKLSLL